MNTTDSQNSKDLSKESSDRRIRKTKALLRKSLTHLLMVKDLKDITISELTELADINRGTFYLHYRDIYDLFNQMEKELLEDFSRIIDKHKKQNVGLALPTLLETFHYIAINSETFIAILRTRETNFLSKVIEMNRPRTQEEWRDLVGNTKKEYFEYYYTFITSGCIALIERWFAMGMPETPEDMARLTVKMMRSCIQEPI